MIESANSAIKEDILNAAESLFATSGYEGTSLRQITARAQVNLAAVNYHFGDKETLYREVIIRRLRPINKSRLALLEKAEQAAGASPAALALILEAMARPLFEMGQYQSDERHQMVRLIGRSLSEPQPFMATLIETEVQPVMARFAQALRRHLPSLSPEEFLWHFSFVAGALHHALSTMHTMKSLTRGICRDHDSAAALSAYIRFGVATFDSLSLEEK